MNAHPASGCAPSGRNSCSLSEALSFSICWSAAALPSGMSTACRGMPRSRSVSASPRQPASICTTISRRRQSEPTCLSIRCIPKWTFLPASMQALIDHPRVQEAVGTAIERDPSFSTALTYNPAGDWWQNDAGRGLGHYGLGLSPRCDPAACGRMLQPWFANSTAFNIIGPSRAGDRNAQAADLLSRAEGARRSFARLLTPTRRRLSIRSIPVTTARTCGTSSFPNSTRIGSPGCKIPRASPVDDDITNTPALHGWRHRQTHRQLLPSGLDNGPQGRRGRRRSRSHARPDGRYRREREDRRHRICVSSAMSNGNVLAITPEGEKTLGIQQFQPCQ